MAETNTIKVVVTGQDAGASKVLAETAAKAKALGAEEKAAAVDTKALRDAVAQMTASLQGVTGKIDQAAVSLGNLGDKAEQARVKTKKTGDEVVGLQGKIKGLQSPVSATAGAVNALGGAFGVMGSTAGSVVSGVVGAFASGSPLILAIGAGALAVGALVSIWNDVREAQGAAAKQAKEDQENEIKRVRDLVKAIKAKKEAEAVGVSVEQLEANKGEANLQKQLTDARADLANARSEVATLERIIQGGGKAAEGAALRLLPARQRVTSAQADVDARTAELRDIRATRDSDPVVGVPAGLAAPPEGVPAALARPTSGVGSDANDRAERERRREAAKRERERALAEETDLANFLAQGAARSESYVYEADRDAEREKLKLLKESEKARIKAAEERAREIERVEKESQSRTLAIAQETASAIQSIFSGTIGDRVGGVLQAVGGIASLFPGGQLAGGLLGTAGGLLGGLFHTGGYVGAYGRRAHGGRYMGGSTAVGALEGEAFLDRTTTASMGGREGIARANRTGSAGGGMSIGSVQVVVQGGSRLTPAQMAESVSQGLQRATTSRSTRMGRGLSRTLPERFRLPR